MGPLAGIKIVEIAGLGPAPFAAMMLGDMGADVVRVDRVDQERIVNLSDPRHDVHGRSRRSIAVDLRQPAGREIVLKLAAGADCLIEPFRPGVAERLGIGPSAAMARNPRLIYGRMTGWGQQGPLAHVAGHDINYIALTGALRAIGVSERPVVPINLLGDYGGGGMMLAFGLLCALLEVRGSGLGQVVDASIIDGTAAMLGHVRAMMESGIWRDARETNIIDGGAHFYGVYETADNEFVSIGALEPKFYSVLLEKLDLAGEQLPDQTDRDGWTRMKHLLADRFRQRTREEWCSLMDGADCCFAPVLSMAEAPSHPHALARHSYVDMDGVKHPAPTPLFSRTPGEASMAPRRGAHTKAVLDELGLGLEEIEALLEERTIACGED